MSFLARLGEAAATLRPPAAGQSRPLASGLHPTTGRCAVSGRHATVGNGVTAGRTACGPLRSEIWAANSLGVFLLATFLISSLAFLASCSRPDARGQEGRGPAVAVRSGSAATLRSLADRGATGSRAGSVTGSRAGSATGPRAGSMTGPRAGSVTDGAVFVPLRYYVGDEVEALAPLEPPAGWNAGGFELKPGSGLPLSGPTADPLIRSVTVERSSSGWEARIRFVPWSPGPGSLPAIEARGWLIPAVSYEVASTLVPGVRDLAPPRPQLEPPGVAVYLYAFAAIVLVLVLIALGTAVYLVPAARSLLAQRRSAQAFRRLRRGLAFLSRGLDSAQPELFYAVLARELRIYLAARVEPRAPNLSSREFAALADESFPASGLRERAAALVAETERGRYSGELTPGAEAADILAAAAAKALELGAATEEAFGARL